MRFSFFVLSFLPLLSFSAPLRCPVNHYQEGSICVECGHAMKWCITCTGMGACTECAAGAYLDSGFCKPCDSICERCNGPGSCTACIKSYCRAPNGTCEHPGAAHIGCNHCSHNTNNCESCEDGYFYTGSGVTPCKPCAGGCKTCNSASECLVALPGYYVDPSTKTPVNCTVSNCAICTESGNQCTECSPQYGLSSSSSSMCEACSDPTCFICKMKDKCNTCQPGYALASDGICRTCARNCLSCADGEISRPGDCLENGCSAGFAYSHFFRRCYPCPEECASCYTIKERGARVCVRCINGITPITDASIYGIWCSSLPNKTCLPGSYLDNGECISCYAQIHACIECTARYTCTECLPGYYLSDNLCVACDDNCLTCGNGPTQCKSCDRKYIVKDGKCVLAEEVIPNCEEPADDTGGSMNCKICKAGFYLNENSSCTACVANCEKCDGPDLTNCSLGFNGYQFDLSTNTLKKCTVNNCERCPDNTSLCDVCKLGFYLSSTGTTCTEGKISNCKNYAPGGATCQHCLPGYGITDDQAQCLPCPAGCKGECSATTCESASCFQGYYYDVNICKPCPPGCAACAKDSYGVVFCTRCTSMAIVAITSVQGLFCGTFSQPNRVSPGAVSAIVILLLVVIGFAIATPFLIKWAKKRGSRSGWGIKSARSVQGSEEHDKLLIDKQGLI